MGVMNSATGGDTGDAHAVGRSGELRLIFERQFETQNGQTALVESYSRPPLQVMRPIRDAAGCLCVYLLSPTGGVVQGDRYTLSLTLHEGTHALFTTQSATKIYRMPDGCAEQQVRIEVGRGAFLEYVPDAAILFAEADYQQHTDAIIHDGGLALLTDVVMPGRLARGERLQFRHYANRLKLHDDRGVIAFESTVIEPEQHSADAMGRLDGFSCWGSAYVTGDFAAWKLDAGAFAGSFHALMTDLLPETDGIGGVSVLHRGGISVRVLSHRLETIYAVFAALRDHARTAVGISPAPLRK